MAILLSGHEVVTQLNVTLRRRADLLRQGGVTPSLALFRVGDDPADLDYVKSARRRAELVGVHTVDCAFPADADEYTLLKAMEKINGDENIHGVLVFRPFSANLRAREDFICNHLAPEKDVDGITDSSAAGVLLGRPRGFAPCTAAACMEILRYYGIDCAGKRAVVVGRSPVVGKPVTMMLMQSDATVTVCHTKTANLAAATRDADILISATGCAGLIGAEHVHAGMTVIDVGTNYSASEGRIVGDVRFREVEPIVRAITPVPGGVGVVTTTILMEHVIEAAERALDT